jgi:ankyrin repeat protein
VQLLLANGASLNKVDDCRRGALFVAANAGSNNAVLALVSWSASVNKRDEARQTLFHATARAGSIAIMRALLNVGANAACTDDNRTHMLIPAGTMKYCKCINHSEALHCSKCSVLAR